jgi:hypothetical protein
MANRKQNNERKILESPHQLMSPTSRFRKIDSDSLNVIYQGSQNLKDVLPETKKEMNPSLDNFFYLSNLDIPRIPIPQTSKEEKTLVNYINKIRNNENETLGTEESNTDSFVDYILRKLGLDEYSFLLRVHKLHKFNVGDTTISSIPEFIIEKDDTVIFIDEEKHLRNITPGKSWGEYQIAGEIIAAAAMNYKNQVIRNDRSMEEYQTIYCMRVVGTKFTFYKSKVPLEYLIQLEDGFPDKSLTITRFPDDKRFFSYMDYTDPTQRKIIIKALSVLENGL